MASKAPRTGAKKPVAKTPVSKPKAAAPKEKELNLDFLREDDGNLVF